MPASPPRRSEANAQTFPPTPQPSPRCPCPRSSPCGFMNPKFTGCRQLCWWWIRHPDVRGKPVSRSLVGMARRVVRLLSTDASARCPDPSWVGASLFLVLSFSSGEVRMSVDGKSWPSTKAGTRSIEALRRWHCGLGGDPPPQVVSHLTGRPEHLPAILDALGGVMNSTNPY